MVGAVHRVDEWPDRLVYPAVPLAPGNPPRPPPGNINGHVIDGALLSTAD
jgi:hypothetical protein